MLSTFLLLFVPVFPTQLALKTFNFGIYLLDKIKPSEVNRNCLKTHAILLEHEKTHSEYYKFVSILTIVLYQYVYTNWCWRGKYLLSLNVNIGHNNADYIVSLYLFLGERPPDWCTIVHLVFQTRVGSLIMMLQEVKSLLQGKFTSRQACPVYTSCPLFTPSHQWQPTTSKCPQSRFQLQTASKGKDCPPVIQGIMKAIVWCYP